MRGRVQRDLYQVLDKTMLTGWKLFVSKLFIIPQRYVFGLMSLLAIANAYTMRVCLNLAITQMVKKSSSGGNGGYIDPDACPDPLSLVQDSSNATEVYDLFSDTSDKFDWSESTQGLLLSSFYYGYIITHIPGGIVAEKFGGKWITGLGLLFTAVCTLVTPIVVRFGGAPALFILRVVEGLGEGATVPGLVLMMSQWVPPHERAKMGALVFGGSMVGNIVGSIFSGLIMHEGKWDNVFYVFGGVAVFWFMLWTVLVYNTPNSHPFITEKEKTYLNETVDALMFSKKQILEPVPWNALLRSPPLYALIIAAIGHDWGYFTMITDLPKYMTDVLKFDIKKTGLLSASPFIAMWVLSFVFSTICDFCIKRKYHSIVTARKVYTTIGATGPAICIVMASYSGCNTTLAMVWFVLSMALMAAYLSGNRINTLDISPNYAGTTTAIVNGIAAVAGIISPYLVGLLTPDSTLKQWRLAFWIAFGMLVSTNIVYVLWAQGDQAWWDDVKKHGYPITWTHGPLPKKPTNIEANPERASTDNKQS